jgi:MFS family permease
MAEAASRSGKTEPADERETRRNARLIILNGGVMELAHSFASSEAVIPAYIQLLTGSSIYVGLSRAMMRVGWAWPQILISNLIEGRERKKPVFIWGGLVRCCITVTIGVATWVLAEESPGVLLGIYLGLYAVATSMMGVTNVPWMDVIGKVIPSGERSRVFALRRLLGGGLAIGSGLVISYMVSDASGLAFPKGYAVLFIISGVVTAVSVSIFGLIREPVENVARAREPMRSYLAGGFRLLREDLDYRRLFILRYLWAAAMMGTSFYVPYALSDLQISMVYIGLFVSVSQASSILSNALWARIGKRGGSRALMIIGTYLLGASLVVPLVTPYVPSIAVSPFDVFGVATFDTRVLFFSLTFLCNGFATSGMFTGRMALVLDLAPEDRRPTYTSFMNTLGVPQGLMPILGGFLAAWLSYGHVFFIGLCFLPPAILLAHRIQQKS